jgi:hypothetical protein
MGEPVDLLRILNELAPAGKIQKAICKDAPYFRRLFANCKAQGESACNLPVRVAGIRQLNRKSRWHPKR